MKTKILMLVVLIGLSAVLVAQPGDRGPKKPFRGQGREMQMGNGERRGPANELMLTDEQKEAFKKSRLALEKQLQPIRNEIGEAEARQKTLTTAEKPDLAAINKNIEKIGGLRVEMEKIQTKHRLDMRAQLTEEQRLKFDRSRNGMRGFNGMRGPGGFQGRPGIR